MINDVIRDAEGRMKKSIEALRQHLSTIRTGRASPALVEHMQVEAWGSTMPLNQLAGITTPDARMIMIQPYDKTTLKAIEKAIQNSDLGINPSNDGVVIRLALPPLTEERRRTLTKQVKGHVEEGKVAVRNLRREAVDAIKKLEHDKQISENDQRRAQERLQELTDRYIRDLEQIGVAKEAEVMEV
ncbi:MAG: ribosome recycling factor [Chloroflexi bacterium SZAS-1]|jgi:ribosome recycling factor|nr:ribosome recycling factor [Chloroflexi bacterium SZAS-1]HNP88325.1 ribosome recycling factor [Kouleothrix sp.]